MSNREGFPNATEVQGVQCNQVKIEEFGALRKIRESPHCKSNHLITQSQPYFPGKPLRCYLDFPGMQPAAVIVFFGSWFAGLGLYVAIICLIVSAFSIGFFIQHEIVSQKSLPLVLSQPIFAGRFLNNVYKVTLSELKGVALTNYQQGIGYMQVSETVIQFQALHPMAVEVMKRARKFSRILLFCFIFSGILDLAMIIYHLKRRGPHP